MLEHTHWPIRSTQRSVKREPIVKGQSLPLRALTMETMDVHYYANENPMRR